MSLKEKTQSLFANVRLATLPLTPFRRLAA